MDSPVPVSKLQSYSLQSVSLGYISGLEVHIFTPWGKSNLEKRSTPILEDGLGQFGQGTPGCWSLEHSLEGEDIDSSWALLLALQTSDPLRNEHSFRNRGISSKM